jgi:hypothetical protein
MFERASQIIRGLRKKKPGRVVAARAVRGVLRGKINEPSEASAPAELADRELRPRGRREPEPHAAQEAVPAGEPA